MYLNYWNHLIVSILWKTQFILPYYGYLSSILQIATQFTLDSVTSGQVQNRGFSRNRNPFLTSFELFSSANFIVSRNTCWNRMRHRSNYLVIRRCDYFAHFNSKSLSNVSLVCSGLLYLDFSISNFFFLSVASISAVCMVPAGSLYWHKIEQRREEKKLFLW